MPFDPCNHSEPRCESEEKCASRERFKRNCESIQFVALDQRSFDVRKRDKDFTRDAEAYKRLRKEGLQPRGVDKSAMLEAHADHKVQVTLGKPVTDAHVKAFNRDFGSIA